MRVVKVVRHVKIQTKYNKSIQAVQNSTTNWVLYPKINEIKPCIVYQALTQHNDYIGFVKLCDRVYTTFNDNAFKLSIYLPF